jgi:transcriptional regulator with XRE-family HTH domain
MTFGEKIKKLRTSRNLTQEELAGKIYVTRTAVSKWESDRGYPNIDSLKAIARFFSITVDELLSPDEILTIAEENQKQTEKRIQNLLFGLLDICMALLLFLPLFANKSEEVIKSASLLTLSVETYLKVLYFVVVIAMVALGLVTLILRKHMVHAWQKSKTLISLSLGTGAAILFIISQQPYAAIFAFSLLVIKSVMMIRRT